jgi:ATP-dependent Clp protease adaptor protein ClpS
MGTTVVSPEIEAIDRDELTPAYNVVLLNDDYHSYDYVIEMLQTLFVFSLEQAIDHTVEVDKKGRTILLTCGLSEAEFARDQIHAYGPDPNVPECVGSMSAVIEPANG